MYILVICNNHESDVWMNGSVKFVEELKQKINKHRHLKCKFIVTIMWNIL